MSALSISHHRYASQRRLRASLVAFALFAGCAIAPAAQAQNDAMEIADALHT